MVYRLVDKTDTGRSMVDGFAYGRDIEPVVGEPRSNNSTMSTGSSLTERESTDSAGADDVAPADRNIVTRVLFSSTHNINLLHEVFHQVSLIYMFIDCWCSLVRSLDISLSHRVCRHL